MAWQFHENYPATTKQYCLLARSDFYFQISQTYALAIRLNSMELITFTMNPDDTIALTAQFFMLELSSFMSFKSKN